MSYMVEAGASSSRRARRRRALITLLVVVVLLFSAFWYAYSYFEASSAPKAAGPGPTATCTGKPGAPTPGTTTVNVYNATQRRGLAAATATQVRKRGFLVSTVSNDPLQKTVTGPGRGALRQGRGGPRPPRAGPGQGRQSRRRTPGWTTRWTWSSATRSPRWRRPPKPVPAAKTTTRPTGC